MAPSQFAPIVAFSFALNLALTLLYASFSFADVHLDGQRFTNGDVEFGMPRISGKLDPEGFLSEARKKRFGLLYCYDLDGKKGRLLWGAGEIEIKVGANGKVLDSEWSKPISGEQEFGKCSKRMIKQWAFPKGPATVAFPMSVTTSTTKK